ncbi:MAG: crossover junction endodeoxyribonuclease RuvC [Bacteroidetes bacterium]|nr:crossover junction endodeoxyribonuclease RuvC [Bacteroidota bacterium]
MIILGVDPGTRTTGYGIIRFEKNNYSVVDSGIIKLDEKKDISARLVTLYSRLTTLIDVWKPVCMGVETAFFNKNIASTMKLGNAKGVILLAAAQHDIQIVELSPREVKRHVTGNGNASKQQVEAMIFRLLNMEARTQDFDMSDALAIALSAGFSVGPGSAAHKTVTQTVSRGKRSAWASYVNQNSDRIIK